MTQMITQNIRPAGSWDKAIDTCVMSYDERFLRRKVVQTKAGGTLLVDLAKVTSLDHGDGFETTEGKVIEIRAAEEPLLAVTAPDLPRIAWRSPCGIKRANVVTKGTLVTRFQLSLTFVWVPAALLR